MVFLSHILPFFLLLTWSFNLSNKKKLEFIGDFRGRTNELNELANDLDLIKAWSEIHIIYTRKNIRFLKSYNFIKSPRCQRLREHILQGHTYPNVKIMIVLSDYQVRFYYSDLWAGKRLKTINDMLTVYIGDHYTLPRADQLLNDLNRVLNGDYPLGGVATQSLYLANITNTEKPKSIKI